MTLKPTLPQNHQASDSSLPAGAGCGAGAGVGAQTIEPPMPQGLQHSSDETPGIHRVLRSQHFSYQLTNGQTVTDAAQRQRIAHGSKEHMRKPGTDGAPDHNAFEKAAEAKKVKKVPAKKS